MPLSITRSTFYDVNIVIALSSQLVRFLLRDIAFGSCICFEEQFLSCDSLRPIRTYGPSYNDFFFASVLQAHSLRDCMSLR